MSFFLTFLFGFFVQFALSLFYDHPPRNSSLTFSLWGHSSVSLIFAIPLHHRYIYVIPQYYSSFSFFFVIPHWLFLGFFLCYSSLSFLFFLSLCHSSFFVIFLCHSSLLFLVVLFLCYSSLSFLIFLSLCHSSLYFILNFSFMISLFCCLPSFPFGYTWDAVAHCTERKKICTNWTFNEYLLIGWSARHTSLKCQR